MSSSGLTGTIAVTSEALMQDFKAGQLLKSNPRNLTIAQLIAAPVGSIATAIVYPVLRNKFGIGATTGMRPKSLRTRLRPLRALAITVPSSSVPAAGTITGYL